MPPVPLRGGAATWDGGTRTLTLDSARYVEDLAVSGTVHLSTDNVVTADLRGTHGDSEPFDLRLRWQAFIAEDVTEVTSDLNETRRPY